MAAGAVVPALNQERSRRRQDSVRACVVASFLIQTIATANVRNQRYRSRIVEKEIHPDSFGIVN